MDEAINTSISEPLDLVRLCLGERVFVKLRGDRTIAGQLHAYDAHMNLVLGGAEESVHAVEITEDGQALPPKVEKRNMEMLFVRGDSVILSKAQSLRRCRTPPAIWHCPGNPPYLAVDPAPDADLLDIAHSAMSRAGQNTST